MEQIPEQNGRNDNDCIFLVQKMEWVPEEEDGSDDDSEEDDSEEDMDAE